MKRFRILVGVLTCFLVLGVATAVPAGSVWAVEPRTADSDSSSSSNPITPTFSVTAADSYAQIRFGNNVLTAGNDATVSDTVKGLLFSFGNNFEIRSTSATNFVAGNAIQYHGQTTGDLFIAGNLITIASDSAIGGSIFGAGNEIVIESSKLSGDLSIAASKLVLTDGLKIAGNVNLSVGQLVVEGQVEIAGALTYNDDIIISNMTGSSNPLTYAELSTYTPTTYSPTADQIFMEMLAGLISLALITILLILVFPGIKTRIPAQATTSVSARAFLVGLGIMFFVPIIAVFCLFSIFGAAAGIVLLVIYALAFYLATGFAGAWLGHLIIEKIAHGRAPFWLETLFGITVISLVSIVPVIGSVVKMAAMILGVGLIIGCLRPDTSSADAVDTGSAKGAASGFLKGSTGSTAKDSAKNSAKNSTKDSAKNSAAGSAKSSAKSSTKK